MQIRQEKKILFDMSQGPNKVQYTGRIRIGKKCFENCGAIPC